MKLKWLLAWTALAVGLCLSLAGVQGVTRPAKAATPPITIEIVGDSITVGADQPGNTFRDILRNVIYNSTGTLPVIHYYAAGGWSTAEAWPGFPASLAAWQPDLVLFALGTNDQWDTTGAQNRMQAMIGTVKDWQQQHPTQFAVSFISYSVGPHVNFQPAEAQVNDALYRAYLNSGLLATPFPTMYAGLADMQPLGVNCFDAQGVHPNAAGYDVMGHIWYNAVRGYYGWPAYAPWTPLCSLNGHRPS